MEFLISPEEQPPWAVEPTQLQDQVLERWPGTRAYAQSAEAPMALGLEVPDPRGDLEVSLSRDGGALHLDGELEVAADFAAWWATQAPGLEPEVRVYDTADLERSVALRRDITADEVREALRYRAAGG